MSPGFGSEKLGWFGGPRGVASPVPMLMTSHQSLRRPKIQKSHHDPRTDWFLFSARQLEEYFGLCPGRALLLMDEKIAQDPCVKVPSCR